MGTLLAFLVSLVRGMLSPQADLALENAALRQQLGTYLRKKKRPKLRPTDRALWVVLRKIWPNWKGSLVVVKPDTVISWHRQGFRLFWRWKSRTKKVGRPPIPRAHVELIRRMSRENPTWGEDRIADELRFKLGITHSTSTVRKYMARRCGPRDGQGWLRFLTNHSNAVFACDFLVQHTARFELVYVFVVMEVATRRIALINTTKNPSLEWVKGQIREVTAFGLGRAFSFTTTTESSGNSARGGPTGPTDVTSIDGCARSWAFAECPRPTGLRMPMLMSNASI
jgi:hypothetical protein